MTTKTPPSTDSAVAAIASYENPLALRTFQQAQQIVAKTLGITEPTARKRLRAAVDTGQLVQIEVWADWRAVMPGDEAFSGLDVFAQLSAPRNLTTQRPAHRRSAPHFTFLVSPEQHAEIVRIFTAEWETAQEKEEQERRALIEDNWAKTRQRDPELAELLQQLSGILPHSDIRPLPLTRSEIVKPWLMIAGRDLETFKEVLRAGLAGKSETPSSDGEN